MQDISESGVVSAEPITVLRQRWEQSYGTSPPRGLGRQLLIRGISWKEQEKVHGGFPSALKRELARLADQLDRSGELDVERQMSLKAGTRLVREWRGRTCYVTVLQDGFLFEDRRYASLSKIATSITGTKWSGPRFFGLRQRSRPIADGALGQ